MRVDPTSLADAQGQTEDAAHRLASALRRALTGTGGRASGDPRHPGAEFDEEYARLMEHAPQALSSLTDRAADQAARLFKAAATHAAAEQSAGNTVQRIADR
ncbi:hypothetical protein FHR32_003717 [Streptosporangium album]|uniref:Excreted virulence factor EspC, type VII ESX diderm n=1 Tax=Streptosporangium album TaxID=47479 RepID=A0A7W7RWW2_9ACTN|nr:hypothetical protein [Streptosporangium album]MBB4939412.1 hypothetical protein [Streptosporangium album]